MWSRINQTKINFTNTFRRYWQTIGECWTMWTKYNFVIPRPGFVIKYVINKNKKTGVMEISKCDLNSLHKNKYIINEKGESLSENNICKKIWNWVSNFNCLLLYSYGAPKTPYQYGVPYHWWKLKGYNKRISQINII